MSHERHLTERQSMVLSAIGRSLKDGRRTVSAAEIRRSVWSGTAQRLALPTEVLPILDELQGLGLVSGATESDLVRRWKLSGGVL